MKLTKKKAIELSIKKWEWIVENNGSNENNIIFKDIPEIINLKNECGLCEKYLQKHKDKLFVGCFECPIKPDNYNYKNEHLGCCTSPHPFSIWNYNETKENAQKVLDLIKSIK